MTASRVLGSGGSRFYTCQISVLLLCQLYLACDATDLYVSTVGALCVCLLRLCDGRSQSPFSLIAALCARVRVCLHWTRRIDCFAEWSTQIYEIKLIYDNYKK